MTKKTPKPPKNIDDLELWGFVTSDIKPLQQRHKNIATPVSQALKTAIAPLKGRSDPVAVPPPGRVRKPSTLPELGHGASPGVDKSTAGKFKKGRRTIEARLDLHGMTQNQAHGALDSFIDKACRDGRRCVLVVTGKGAKLDGSVGVLRQAVPRWLNLAPNRPRILAFSYATAKDGGEGALYVLLKRQR